MPAALQDLRDRRGGHIALPLCVAPHTGQQAHAEYGGSQCPYSGSCQRVIQKAGKTVRLREHQHGAHQPQTEKQPDSRVENFPLFIFQALRVGLTGHPGDGQRQTRRGEGQKKIVNAVGGIKIRFARAAQNIVQRQLVNGADDLHHHHRRRQNGGTAQKGLLFCRSCHANTSAFQIDSQITYAARTAPLSLLGMFVRGGTYPKPL